MKFKKYVKDLTPSSSKMSLAESLFDNDYNPDRTSYARDELDRVYNPIQKMIDEGKFDEARKELTELEADLNDLEATNSKKKFFKYPQFMIDGQRRRIEALKSKLPKNESLNDMDKRCEKCNTLLNDSGTCPKCDDGEEDYEDNTDLDEELSNKEKLKRAFPELNFDKPMNEEHVEEALSNKEKLKRAFPELNFDAPALTEAIGADTAHAVKDTMNNLAKDDKNTWAKKTAEIMDVIPDSFMDELFENIKKSLANIKLNTSDKKKVFDAAEDAIAEENVENDTLGAILDAIDITEWSKKNPKFVKTFLTVVLGIVAVIEPTPVVEVITAVVMLLPENVVAKIASILSVTTNPVAAGAAVANKVHDAKNESLSVRDKLKAAYPELDFGESVEEGLLNINVDASGQSVGLLGGTGGTVESLDTEDFDYDDDYDIEDDVEMDRRHAALYGGERMYCDCGRKLSFNEWGSYCPFCETEESSRTYSDEPEDYYDDNM